MNSKLNRDIKIGIIVNNLKKEYDNLKKINEYNNKNLDQLECEYKKELENLKEHEIQQTEKLNQKM